MLIIFLYYIMNIIYTLYCIICCIRLGYWRTENIEQVGYHFKNPEEAEIVDILFRNSSSDTPESPSFISLSTNSSFISYSLLSSQSLSAARNPIVTSPMQSS